MCMASDRFCVITYLHFNEVEELTLGKRGDSGWLAVRFLQSYVKLVHPEVAVNDFEEAHVSKQQALAW